MSGTIEGGKQAAETNKLKWGEDFYQRIGAKGGKKGKTGGFYANRELAREAGRKGGLKSRRGKGRLNAQI
jgi:general stress protein YciG